MRQKSLIEKTEAFRQTLCEQCVGLKQYNMDMMEQVLETSYRQAVLRNLKAFIDSIPATSDELHLALHFNHFCVFAKGMVTEQCRFEKTGEMQEQYMTAKQELRAALNAFYAKYSGDDPKWDTYAKVFADKAMAIIPIFIQYRETITPIMREMEIMQP